MAMAGMSVARQTRNHTTDAIPLTNLKIQTPLAPSAGPPSSHLGTHLPTPVSNLRQLPLRTVWTHEFSQTMFRNLPLPSTPPTPRHTRPFAYASPPGGWLGGLSISSHVDRVGSYTAKDRHELAPSLTDDTGEHFTGDQEEE